MAHFALALMKYLKIHLANTLFGPKINFIVTSNERGLLQHKEFPALLRDILNVPSMLDHAKRFMVSHNRSHVLHVVSASFFAAVSDVQIGQCRVGALMLEPSLQPILHRMANPEQNRQAVDNEEGRVSAMRTQCYQQFAAQYNSAAVDPTFKVDVSVWLGLQIDVTRPPIQQTWIWVAETMAHLRTHVGKALRNFNASGRNAGGLDDMARDLEFFSDFCFGDPVLFFVYMCWDHGRNVPSWNNACLPDGVALDVGVRVNYAPEQGTASNSNKRKRTDADDTLSEFVKSSQLMLQAALTASAPQQPASTDSLTNSAASTASMPEERAALRAAAIAKHAALIQGQLETVPQTDTFKAVKAQLESQLLALLTSLAQV